MIALSVNEFWRLLPPASCYGVRRIHVLLRPEGWPINHEKTYRIYCEEGLNLWRKRPRRRVVAAHRQERPAVSSLNDCWSMDFVTDQLFNDQKIRALTVVDDFSRESLAITVDYALKDADVVATMRHVQALCGTPQRIRVDNGSEFISVALDQWAYEHGVTLDFSRPGKPTDNALIESFNGSLRDECLNVHCSCRWKTRATKSSDGDRITTNSGRTVH